MESEGDRASATPRATCRPLAPRVLDTCEGASQATGSSPKTATETTSGREANPAAHAVFHNTASALRISAKLSLLRSVVYCQAEACPSPTFAFPESLSSEAIDRGAPQSLIELFKTCPRADQGCSSNGTTSLHRDRCRPSPPRRWLALRRPPALCAPRLARTLPRESLTTWRAPRTGHA